MDYMPKRRAERREFYRNLRANIAVEGPKFGLSAADCTAFQAVVEELLGQMDATDTAQQSLQRERDREAQIETSHQARVRAAVRHWKTLPGYAAAGSEAVLHLRGDSVVFNPTTYKPKFKATVLPGQVRLDFIKSGVDGLLFYWRRRGSLTWTKLAFDTNPPCFDTQPLATPNVPEAREYKARGVIDDVEIGLESDIVVATFAG